MKAPAIEEVDGNTLEGKRAIVASLERDLAIASGPEMRNSVSGHIYRMNKYSEISNWKKRMIEEHGTRE